MRVPRSHYAGDLALGTVAELAADSAHHLCRVLRLRDGAEVRLFNGRPGDWVGRLESRGRGGAVVHVERFEPRASESPLAITLVQGLSRGQRMDYTLQKSVELGVDRIQPLVMARSQAVPTGERLARKAAHWAGVIESAAGQSGRTRLPALAPLVGFDRWLAEAAIADEPHLLLDPDASMPAQALGHPARMTLIAGPEGGFAPGERERMAAAGCLGLRLGPRVLRTETAAVVALAVMQARYGDL